MVAHAVGIGLAAALRAPLAYPVHFGCLACVAFSVECDVRTFIPFLLLTLPLTLRYYGRDDEFYALTAFGTDGVRPVPK